MENFFSFAEDFGLVCEWKREVDHASSVYLLGSMLVGPIALQLSDLYGRRLPFLISIYASVVSNFIAASAPTYFLFLLARFISGIADACLFSAASTLSVESVSSQFRSFIPIFFNVYWLAGYMFVGFLRLSIHNWRILWAIAAAPTLLAIPLYHQIPESLHWLIGKKKNRDIKEYIDYVSQYNGQEVDLKECQNMSETLSIRPQRTIFDVCKSPSLLRVVLVNVFIYIVASFTYWALSLHSYELSSDKMTGFFLSGLVELPGTIIANMMIYYLNRRTVSFISLAAISVSLASASFFSTPFSTTFFSLVGKGSSVVLISSQPLFCMECSPTTVRNIIQGIVGFARDFATFLTPYITWLAVFGQHTPVLFISVLAALASATVFLLPETRGKRLPEDIEEMCCRPKEPNSERIALLEEDS